MEKEARPAKRGRGGAVLKALLFLAFIIAAVYTLRTTPAKDFFTQQALGKFLDQAGFWAPLVFILVYAAAVCMFVPGSVVTALGAALFGPYWGFLYVYAGAMIGSSVAFWIGRTLGREFAASLIGDRLKKYDEAVALIRLGGERLRIKPNGSLVEDFIPCQKDRERLLRYADQMRDAERFVKARDEARKEYDKR